MGVFRIVARGLRRALASPRLILLLWLVNLAAAVPASLVVGQALAGSFGHSLVSRHMLEGFDLGWHAEFEARARGLESTFRPSVSGPGPVLDNLDAWWSGRLVKVHPSLVALGAGYAVVWAFLLGGVLDRLARPRAKLALDRFFSAGGKYLLRFVGLALISGVAYFLVYASARQLYRFIEASTRDVIEERMVLAWVLAVSALAVLLLLAVRTVFDYAKIATVTEERRNVLAAAVAGLRFVARHPAQTFSTTLAFSALGASLVALYVSLAPGAGQSTFAAILLAFGFSQVYLAARLVLRLGLLGAETSLYHGLRRVGP